MSIRKHVIAAAVSLGALGIAGPVAVSSADTVSAIPSVNTITPIVNDAVNNAASQVNTAIADATSQQQAAQGALPADAQTAIDGWQSGMQAAQAGFAATATALGLPAGP
jgi:hypothetical protein